MDRHSGRSKQFGIDHSVARVERIRRIGRRHGVDGKFTARRIARLW